ncbi:carnosine N-methyltransferase-like isoform X2 [Dysidea avara]|uniref:carnosine N-methyltransferase-like isoform X2 n=1 Tax=Dysidea avara TaxID=196820 RepID=UPI0033198550
MEDNGGTIQYGYLWDQLECPRYQGVLIIQMLGGFQQQLASGFDMEKVKTTIKQFYRDWSSEGQAERDTCYKPIIDEIKERFPPDKCVPSEVNVLVPGAGLGRLAWEIAQLGYCCQGNEFSMYMLFSSHYILNEVKEANMITIHPWLLHFNNSMSYHHQLCGVKIPDVVPTDLPSYGLFSMAAGDFLEVYTRPDEWDCVATCYFMDTAHNIVAYLENIFYILKPGGYWINFGPLLYHFADMPNELSIELCYDEVHRIARDEIGFQFLEEHTGMKSSYISDPNSMMQMTYNCVFSVATKPPTTVHTTK